jgi:hypothetical protein
MTEKTITTEASLIEKSAVKARSDWPWVLRWSFLALALSLLPTVWGYLITPPGAQFIGLNLNASDGNTYLAKMQEGARGEWLFSLVYTSEEHQPEFIYIFYLLLGKFQALTGLPGVVIFHLARLLCGLLLLLVGYHFICRYFSQKALRRTAFLLLCFSAGLGWLVSLFGLHDSTDLWIAESLTFSTILANPHFPLATALLLLTVMWTQDGWEGQGWPAYGKAAASAFVLGFVHPFMIVSLAGILGAFVLRRTFQHGAIVWPVWTGTALVGVLGAVGPVYTFIVINLNPVMRGWQAQNQTPSPLLWAYLTGYGLLLVAALPGMWWAETKSEVRSQKSKEISSSLILHPSSLRWQLLTTWFVINALLLYLPLSLQRRLSEGLHIPIVMLATAGLYYVWKLKPKLSTFFVVITTFSNLLVIAILIIMLHFQLSHNNVHPLYLYNEEAEAMTWLRDNTDWRDTVVASPLLGNLLPGQTGNRVYYGHDMETIDSAKKKPLLLRFLEGEMSQAEQQAFIQNNKLRYLFYGPEEAALGQGRFNPAGQGWAVAYSNNKVTIYELNYALLLNKWVALL